MLNQNPTRSKKKEELIQKPKWNQIVREGKKKHEGTSVKKVLAKPVTTKPKSHEGKGKSPKSKKEQKKLEIKGKQPEAKKGKDIPTEEQRNAYIEECKQFRRFYFQQCKRYNCEQSSEILRSINQTMNQGRRFQRISTCHQKHFRMEQMQVIVSCVQNNQHICEVLINHNKISERVVKYFIERMFNNENITSIELFGNHLGDELCPVFGELLKKNKTLKRLKLGDNQITQKGSIELAKGLKENDCLIQLHLGGNKIGDDGVKHLSNALLENRTLNSLGLRDNRITESGIESLSKTLMSPNCALSDIQLKGNRIGVKGCTYLSAALKKNKSLKVLEIQSNEITAEGIKELMDGLKTNRTVHALTFNNNQIKNEGCKYLGELISTNKVIATLGLASNQIMQNGVIELSKSLPNSMITGLDLGNNNIGNEGAIGLSKYLAVTTTLSSLDLRNCAINSKGVEAIAKSLEKNSSLCHLDLGSNFSKNSGAQAFSRLLAVNSSLTRLCLTDNQIYQEGGLSLGIGLQKNYSLRNFSYGGQGVNANRVDSTVRRMIDEIVKDNKRNFETLEKLEAKNQGKGVTLRSLSKLRYRTIDIRKMMSSSGDNRSGRSNIGSGGYKRFPTWLENPIHLIEKTMEPNELDNRLEYIFRSKLLKAENTKFSGFFFIGNVLNTLIKVFPDCKETVDEVLIVKHAYDDEKYYVHLSRELVKTQIKYVGYSKMRGSTSTTPMRSLGKASFFTPQRTSQRSTFVSPKVTYTPGFFNQRSKPVRGGRMQRGGRGGSYYSPGRGRKKQFFNTRSSMGKQFPKSTRPVRKKWMTSNYRQTTTTLERKPEEVKGRPVVVSKEPIPSEPKVQKIQRQLFASEETEKDELMEIRDMKFEEVMQQEGKNLLDEFEESLEAQDDKRRKEKKDDEVFILAPNQTKENPFITPQIQRKKKVQPISPPMTDIKNLKNGKKRGFDLFKPLTKIDWSFNTQKKESKDSDDEWADW